MAGEALLQVFASLTKHLLWMNLLSNDVTLLLKYSEHRFMTGEILITSS